MKVRNMLASSLLALVVVPLLGMSACGKVKEIDPVTPAVQSGRPEVIAVALEGSYTILQSQAADLVEEAETPEAVKKVVKCVAEKANPILDKTRPLAVEAEDLRAKILAAGEGSEGSEANQKRLAVILKDLNEDVNVVAPLVTDLVAAIGGKAQGVCAS